MVTTYKFDGGAGGEGPGGWGWVRDDGAKGCGGLAPGTTSNMAEYVALTMAVRDAYDIDTDSVHFLGDSKLVVEQVTGNWRVKAVNLLPYFNNVRILLESLPMKWTLGWIPRELNSEADAQAWEGKSMWTPGQSTTSVGVPLRFLRGWEVTS